MAHNRTDNRDNRDNDRGKGKIRKTLHAPVVTRVTGEPNAERTARLEALEAAGGRHNTEAYTNPRTHLLFFGAGAPASSNIPDIPSTIPATIPASDSPEVGDRVMLHVQGGSWQGKYRAVTGVMEERDTEGMSEAGWSGPVVWVCREEARKNGTLPAHRTARFAQRPGLSHNW